MMDNRLSTSLPVLLPLHRMSLHMHFNDHSDRSWRRSGFWSMPVWSQRRHVYSPTKLYVNSIPTKMVGATHNSYFPQRAILCTPNGGYQKLIKSSSCYELSRTGVYTSMENLSEHRLNRASSCEDVCQEVRRNSRCSESGVSVNDSRGTEDDDGSCLGVEDEVTSQCSLSGSSAFFEITCDSDNVSVPGSNSGQDATLNPLQLDEEQLNLTHNHALHVHYSACGSSSDVLNTRTTRECAHTPSDETDFVFHSTPSKRRSVGLPMLPTDCDLNVTSAACLSLPSPDFSSVSSGDNDWSTFSEGKSIKKTRTELSAAPPANCCGWAEVKPNESIHGYVSAVRQHGQGLDAKSPVDLTRTGTLQWQQLNKTINEAPGTISSSVTCACLQTSVEKLSIAKEHNCKACWAAVEACGVKAGIKEDVNGARTSSLLSRIRQQQAMPISADHRQCEGDCEKEQCMEKLPSKCDECPTTSSEENEKLPGACAGYTEESNADTVVSPRTTPSPAAYATVELHEDCPTSLPLHSQGDCRNTTSAHNGLCESVTDGSECNHETWRVVRWRSKNENRKWAAENQNNDLTRMSGTRNIKETWVGIPEAFRTQLKEATEVVKDVFEAPVWKRRKNISELCDESVTESREKLQCTSGETIATKCSIPDTGDDLNKVTPDEATGEPMPIILQENDSFMTKKTHSPDVNASVFSEATVLPFASTCTPCFSVMSQQSQEQEGTEPTEERQQNQGTSGYDMLNILQDQLLGLVDAEDREKSQATTNLGVYMEHVFASLPNRARLQEQRETTDWVQHRPVNAVCAELNTTLVSSAVTQRHTRTYTDTELKQAANMLPVCEVMKLCDANLWRETDESLSEDDGCTRTPFSRCHTVPQMRRGPLSNPALHSDNSHDNYSVIPGDNGQLQTTRHFNLCTFSNNKSLMNMEVEEYDNLPSCHPVMDAGGIATFGDVFARTNCTTASTVRARLSRSAHKPETIFEADEEIVAEETGRGVQVNLFYTPAQESVPVRDHVQKPNQTLGMSPAAAEILFGGTDIETVGASVAKSGNSSADDKSQKMEKFQCLDEQYTSGLFFSSGEGAHELSEGVEHPLIANNQMEKQNYPLVYQHLKCFRTSPQCRNQTPTQKACLQPDWVKDTLLLFEKLLATFKQETKERQLQLVEQLFSFQPTQGEGSPERQTEICLCLYGLFTREETEKRQNHVCLLDLCNTSFRFKRYLLRNVSIRHRNQWKCNFMRNLDALHELPTA